MLVCCEPSLALRLDTHKSGSGEDSKSSKGDREELHVGCYGSNLLESMGIFIHFSHDLRSTFVATAKIEVI